eukprot:jgi/Antlo1/2328/1790
MLTYILRIYDIVDEFDDEHKVELCDYYLSLWRTKLQNHNFGSRLPICALADLNALFSRYPFLKKEKLFDFQNFVFERKVLEMRACILDLVDQDYSGDIEHIYKPEKWILEVVNDIKTCFDLKNIEHIKLFRIFNTWFLHEILLIFIAKNKRFGKSGNQLVLNLMFYQTFVHKIAEYNFDDFFGKIVENFQEQSFKGFEALNGILSRYMSSNTK